MNGFFQCSNQVIQKVPDCVQTATLAQHNETKNPYEIPLSCGLHKKQTEKISTLPYLKGPLFYHVHVLYNLKALFDV